MARRPVVAAATSILLDRAAENHPRIAAIIERGQQAAVDNPATDTKAVDPAVTSAVTAEIAPILANAQNKERWWESRVKVGLLIWLAQFVLGIFGLDLTISVEQQDMLFKVVQAFGGDANGIIGGVGLGIAALGRWLKNRPPINWRHPWTLLGIGH